MSEHIENQTQINDDDAAIVSIPRKRVQSDIEFPYADLESSCDLAIALHAKAGGQSADEELAGYLNQSADGGSYRARRSAARMFGLVEIGGGIVALTALGREVANEPTSRAARVEAFLKPELYAAMYEKLRGTIPPPPAGVERMMETMGVSPKQKDRARQAFHKSAIHAGYIDAATGRLIKPTYGPNLPEETPAKPNSNGGGGGGVIDTPLNLDPLLMALLKKIPSAEDGWSETKRVRWFRTFAMNVSQVYDDDENPVEMKIDLAP